MAAQLYQAVLAALLQKSVWMGVRHVVADGVFTETTVRLLVAQIDHLHDRIPDRDLTVDDLSTAVLSNHAGQLATDLVSYTEAIRQAAPADGALVRDLLARELLAQAASKIVAAENTGRLDLAGPAALVARAQDLVDGGSTAPTLTLDSFRLPSAGSERGLILPLGISATLDRTLGGGIGEAEMVTFLGKSNVGKTSVMVAVGSSMVRAGYNVLHLIIGDSSAGKVARLYERSAVRKRKAEWDDGCSREAQRLLAAAGGRLWIKDLSGLDVTPDSVEGVIRSVQRAEQVPVHCVIIDYLELMVPNRGWSKDSSQIRHGYGRLCKQVRGLGRKLGTRIVTAWQVNREGSQKDTATEVDLSECWDIYKHTDALIVLNRSAGEKANNRMRLTLRKQREDDEAQQEVSVFCHWATMTIEDLIGGGNAVHQTGTPENRDDSGRGLGLEYGPGGLSGRPQLPNHEVGAGVRSSEGAEL